VLKPARWRPRVEPGVLLLGVLSYVPLLLTHPGRLGADTKQYLYLDPGRLLSRATSMWDPGVGLGTVTHQNIGYLFPMGPYYWIMEQIGVPDWIAQRIWMGSIFFLAGLGVRALLGSLRWSTRGRTVAMVAYAFSPYVLHYIYKHSVILLPFAALPWLIHFTIRSVRDGGWRSPAAFALVALAAGGINATSLLLVLIGPAIWVIHAVAVEREVTARRAIPPILRIAALGVVTSAWWVVGLMLQGRYGIDILRTTETYQTVSNASSAPEIFRGLGYWFFYGTDALGPWFQSAVAMTEFVPAVALSFTLPILAISAALWTRWTSRVFFIGMAAAGLIVSVGAFPFDSPSPYGSLFAAFTETSSGLALRSTPRALPLLALASAVFLGAGVAAISARLPGVRWAPASMALLLVIANLSPLWTGDLLDAFLERPEDVPSYWLEAAAHLEAGDSSTRAIEVPGIEFASYRWGSTVDPITPGLTDRPFAARELVPWGSAASANLMNATDLPFQNNSYDPAGAAILLRMMGVGDVIARNDLEYERNRSPRPRQMSEWLDATPGLATPVGFGPPTANRANPDHPLIDDVELGIGAADREPRPVEIYPVESAAPILRTQPTSSPVVLAGDAAGIVAGAETGAITGTTPVIYSASVSDDPEAVDQLLTDGARLVITDTNRKSARRWGSSRENDGLTEMADESPVVKDPTDNRLSPVDRRTDTDVQTITEQRGRWRAIASGYGNRLTYTPGDRAARAIDGDPTTSWKVAAFADPLDQWIQLQSKDGPVTTDTIRLLQAPNLNRWMTRARLTFDNSDSTVIDLPMSSRTGQGADIDIGRRTFERLRITILATDPGPRARYPALSGVGFAEIDIDGRTTTEVIRPPIDLLDAVGLRAADHELAWVFARRRSNPAEASVQGEEPAMQRVVETPVPLSLTPGARVRLSSNRTDDSIDDLLGRPLRGGRATSSGRVNGDLRYRASEAFDGSADTYWQSNLNPAAPPWIQWAAVSGGTFEFKGVTAIDDPNHSFPTAAHLEVDGQAGPTFDLVANGPVDPTGRVRLDPVTEPGAVTGSSVRLVIDRWTERTHPDWLTSTPQVMPIALAEVDLSARGEVAPLAGPVEPTVTVACRSDLLTLGGTAVPLSIPAGSTADILAGRPVSAVGCDNSPLLVPSGRTDLVATDGTVSGIDIDTLQLATFAAADPTAPSTPGTRPDAARPAAPSKVQSGRTSVTGRLAASDDDVWLVLGQSNNAGWNLNVGGADLGQSTLINGYANGWRVPASVLASSTTFEMTWTPQRFVWTGLAVSALGALLCLVLLVRSRRIHIVAAKQVTPALVRFWDDFGAPLPIVTAAIVSLASIAASLFFIRGWPWAVAIGVGTFAAGRIRHGWPILRLAAIVLLGLMAAYVVLRQWRSGLTLDFDWPLQYRQVHSVGMAAFVLLGVEAVIEALRGGWRRTTGL